MRISDWSSDVCSSDLFHVDIFDVTMQHSKWLARLGAIGYDSLILLNSFVNYLLKLAGQPKMSFSRKIKSSVKSAVKFMSDFEATAASIAIENGYDYVICGHIHQPVIKIGRASCRDRVCQYV